MIQVLSRSEPSITASFSGKADFMRAEAMQQVEAVPARPSVDEIGVGEILLGRREMIQKVSVLRALRKRE